MSEMAKRGDRPIWEIERTLQDFVGALVRVRAKAFAPVGEDLQRQSRFIPVDRLILPDNTAIDGQSVFFEGRLDQFTRRIGVVYVHLAAPESVGANGIVLFRKRSTVILPGPAIVELAFPYHVERIPLEEANYWRDLSVPQAQFLLPLPD